MEIELLAVVTLSILMTIWYLLAKRANLKRQNKLWVQISKEIKRHSEKVGFRRLGSGAFQISFKARPPLRVVEITFVLMDRENFPHYIFQRILRKKDEVYLKASFLCSPTFRVSSSRGSLSLVEGFSLGNLRLFSDKPSIAASVLLDERIKALTEGMEIKGISVAPEEPHLIIRCNVNEETLKSLIPLAWKLASICCSSDKRGRTKSF